MSSIGKEIRLRRILRGGKTLIVAMDHGVSSGPAAGLEDIRKAVANVAKGGATAVVLHKGVVRFAKDYFDEGLCLVLHLSASTSISTHADRKILVTQVDEAISYGADAVSVHVNLGGEDDDRMIEDLGTTATACDRFGFPLLAMMYPRGSKIKNPYDVDVVKHVARVGAELGADIVKRSFGAVRSPSLSQAVRNWTRIARPSRWSKERSPVVPSVSPWAETSSRRRIRSA